MKIARWTVISSLNAIIGNFWEPPQDYCVQRLVLIMGESQLALIKNIFVTQMVENWFTCSTRSSVICVIGYSAGGSLYLPQPSGSSSKMAPRPDSTGACCSRAWPEGGCKLPSKHSSNPRDLSCGARSHQKNKNCYRLQF